MSECRSWRSRKIPVGANADVARDNVQEIRGLGRSHPKRLGAEAYELLFGEGCSLAGSPRYMPLNYSTLTSFLQNCVGYFHDFNKISGTPYSQERVKLLISHLSAHL